MGREIRMVPPGWEHPRYTKDNAKYRENIGAFIPMYDQPFSKKFAEWLADFDRIRAGDLTDFEREVYPTGLREWLTDDGAPPDPLSYRPDWTEEPTWLQVYETVSEGTPVTPPSVSEGTPVTPPFATKAELVDYLATNGDFWDQKRRAERNSIMPCAPWERANAERFVDRGYAPSMIVTTSASGVEIKSARDGI